MRAVLAGDIAVVDPAEAVLAVGLVDRSNGSRNVEPPASPGPPGGRVSLGRRHIREAIQGPPRRGAPSARSGERNAAS
jgi:hypothetical protein